VKGVSWTTSHVIGDGGVLMIHVTFDSRLLRVTCPATPERVQFAVEKLTQFIREERASAKRKAYSVLH
jgi:hypothetical protein